MGILLVEPPRALFKDEVRRVGLELGLPETIVYRQPFPELGPPIRIGEPPRVVRKVTSKPPGTIEWE